MLNVYGNSGGYWCWITVHQPFDENDLVAICLFYGICWFSIAYNIFMIIVIRKRLNSLRILNVNCFYEKVKYFPIFLILCWIFPSINRILQISDKKIYWMEVLHIIFESSIGFLNMIVYALSPGVKFIIKENYRSFSKSTEKLLFSNENVSIA